MNKPIRRREFTDEAVDLVMRAIDEQGISPKEAARLIKAQGSPIKTLKPFEPILSPSGSSVNWYEPVDNHPDTFMLGGVFMKDAFIDAIKTNCPSIKKFRDHHGPQALEQMRKELSND